MMMSLHVLKELNSRMWATAVGCSKRNCLWYLICGTRVVNNIDNAIYKNCVYVAVSYCGLLRKSSDYETTHGD